MTAPDLFLLGLGGLFLVAIACTVVTIFRNGARERFVTWRPFVTYAVITFGILLARWAIDWLRGDPEQASFVFALVMSAILFGIASAVWFAGFFSGRWRRERRAGILSGSR